MVMNNFVFVIKDLIPMTSVGVQADVTNVMRKRERERWGGDFQLLHIRYFLFEFEISSTLFQMHIQFKPAVVVKKHGVRTVWENYHVSLCVTIVDCDIYWLLGYKERFSVVLWLGNFRPIFTCPDPYG